MASEIGKAYVQIIPSSQGIKGKLDVLNRTQTGLVGKGIVVDYPYPVPCPVFEMTGKLAV